MWVKTKPDMCIQHDDPKTISMNVSLRVRVLRNETDIYNNFLLSRSINSWKIAMVWLSRSICQAQTGVTEMQVHWQLVEGSEPSTGYLQTAVSVHSLLDLKLDKTSFKFYFLGIKFTARWTKVYTGGFRRRIGKSSFCLPSSLSSSQTDLSNFISTSVCTCHQHQGARHSGGRNKIDG